MLPEGWQRPVSGKKEGTIMILIKKKTNNVAVEQAIIVQRDEEKEGTDCQKSKRVTKK